MMKKIKGVIPPMITPFDEYGGLDERNLIRLVEYLSPKVDGLFICGSYGCGPLMSLEERKRVAEIVKKTALPDTKVVVHTGTTNTRDTVELTRHVAEIGCDAASAVGPYYFRYGDDELVTYYETIIKQIDGFPFYIYHNPKFQGYSTSLRVMKILKEIGLSGIKDATFDILTYAVYARELMDDSFDILLGTEAMWVSAHALGCQGYIPGIGNVFPELCRKMWLESAEGRREDSLKTQFVINELRDVMYLARSTQLAIYAIAEIKGIIRAYLRGPFIPATEEERKSIETALRKLEVL